MRMTFSRPPDHLGSRLRARPTLLASPAQILYCRPAGDQSDLIVDGGGILLVRQFLLDELVEELEVLLEGQFVEKCNL